MPPMPPDGSPAGAECFSGLSAMTASVVRNSAALEAAFCRAEVADLLRDDATLEAGVDRDLLERGLQCDLDDVRTGGLVAVQAETLEQAGTGLQQGDAATGDDALLDGRLRVAHGVLDAVLALLELDLGRRTGLDDRDPAGQLGQALLQLLAVVVGVAL